MANILQITPFMHVADVDQAVRFFVDVLGFRTGFHTPGEYAYVEREAAAVRILRASETSGEEQRPGNRAFRYYLDVKDVDSLYTELKPKVDALWQGRIHGPVNQGYGQREFMVVAPDGDLVVFGQAIFATPAAGEDRTLPLVVLMGVTGAGKTTVGTELAALAGVMFADADEYHSAENRQKMTAGIPLTDADRAPWLAALNHLLLEWWKAGRGGVLACSALKESYRQTLAAGLPPGAVQFVLLEGPRELIAARLAGRSHTFMNPKLLDSQFATLEVPDDAFAIVNDRAPELIAAEILDQLQTGAAGRRDGA